MPWDTQAAVSRANRPSASALSPSGEGRWNANNSCFASHRGMDPEDRQRLSMRASSPFVLHDHGVHHIISCLANKNRRLLSGKRSIHYATCLSRKQHNRPRPLLLGDGTSSIPSPTRSNGRYNCTVFVRHIDASSPQGQIRDEPQKSPGRRGC